MKHPPLLVAATAVLFASVALADPQPGRAFPSFSVDDLAGTRHTERDLQGRWTVAFAMTDKDIGPNVTAWRRQVEGRVPAQTRILNFVALDIFGLVATSTIVSQARERAPRAMWPVIWFSRNGDFAEQMGLGDSETPWVFVVDPAGRVALSIHAEVSPAGVARVLAAVGAVP